jgi:hypothetical protein
MRVEEKKTQSAFRQFLREYKAKLEKRQPSIPGDSRQQTLAGRTKSWVQTFFRTDKKT